MGNFKRKDYAVNILEEELLVVYILYLYCIYTQLTISLRKIDIYLNIVKFFRISGVLPL